MATTAAWERTPTPVLAATTTQAREEPARPERPSREQPEAAARLSAPLQAAAAAAAARPTMSPGGRVEQAEAGLPVTQALTVFMRQPESGRRTPVPTARQGQTARTPQAAVAAVQDSARTAAI